MGKYQFQISPQLSKLHDDPELRLLTIQRAVRTTFVIGLRFSGKTQLCFELQSRLEGASWLMINSQEEMIFEAVASVRRPRAPKGELPIVLIEGAVCRRQVMPLIDYLRPRPRFIVMDVPASERLERARRLQGVATWTKRELISADRDYRAELRAVQREASARGCQVQVVEGLDVDAAVAFVVR